MRPRRPAFQVRVITALGVEHMEGRTDVLQDAETYAREAVADHCRRAEVVALEAKGFLIGTVISVWDAERVAAWDAQQLLSRT